MLVLKSDVSSFRSREDLVLENLALRRQLLALHGQRPRTRFDCPAQAVLVCVENVLVRVEKPLVLVTPRTVVNWHRAGFRLYWTWISRFRRVGGRKGVSKEVRALIFRMVAENPTWGAPRAHGELLNLRPNGSRLVSIPWSAVYITATSAWPPNLLLYRTTAK